MYCICCKKDKITPYDPIMDGQLGKYKTEDELLWRVGHLPLIMKWFMMVLYKQ